MIGGEWLQARFSRDECYRDRDRNRPQFLSQDTLRRMSNVFFERSLGTLDGRMTVKKNGSANMPRNVDVASTTKTLYEAIAEMYV